MDAAPLRRILLVVPTFASYSCFLRELAEALGQGGWKVVVACGLSAAMGQERDPEHEKSIEFFDMRLPRGAQPASYLKCSWGLERIVSEVRPSIIHAHFSAAILAVSLLSETSRGRSVGTFQGLQFPLAAGPKQVLLRGAETFATRRLHKVWVLTDDDFAALKRRGITNVELQKGWGFGCRTDLFDLQKFSTEERSKLREKLDIPEKSPVFTFVGRNVAFKGFTLVVKGFLRLLEKRPNARLLIIGDRDPLHPSGLTREEETRMRESPAIIRCGWQREVAPFLAITDALVHPSSREGMPVGCMEAISMGGRLIAPDSRGLRELLQLTNQIPLREISTEAVAEAMECVCAERGKANKVDPEKLEVIRAQLDRRAYVEEQIRIYEGLLEK